MGQAQVIGTVFVFFGLSCAVISTFVDFWCYSYYKPTVSVDLLQRGLEKNLSEELTRNLSLDSLTKRDLTQRDLSQVDLPSHVSGDVSQDYDTGYATYFGLWQLCKKRHVAGRVVTECNTWLQYNHDNQVPLGWLKGCQALIIFGIWLYGSTGLAAVGCIRTRRQTRGAAYMSAVGAFCCAGSTVLFAFNMDRVIQTGSNIVLHAGFGLAASASFFGLLAIYFLWRHTPEAGYQNVDVF